MKTPSLSRLYRLIISPVTFCTFYMGGSTSSESSNKTSTETNDDRIAAGDGSINLGRGASYTGTDGGAVQIAKFNAELMAEQVRAQTDGTKFLIGAGSDVLNKMGDSVTKIYQQSGANTAEAWSHTIDASATIMDRLTAGSKANADAAQTVAVAALNANKSDASGMSDTVKYLAIAAAVVGGAVALRGAR